MNDGSSSNPEPRWSVLAIHRIEYGIYVAIGVMLVLALTLTLAGTVRILWNGLPDWSGTETTFNIVDRLLFVLMMVEILHTVHASMRTGTLVCEPFLIVGLIACVRRVLVITLETSQITRPEHWKVEDLPLFHASMIELAVLAVLIAVLVGSIRLTRPEERSRDRGSDKGGWRRQEREEAGG